MKRRVVASEALSSPLRAGPTKVEPEAHEPDYAFALGRGLALEEDAAERERRGDRFEGPQR